MRRLISLLFIAFFTLAVCAQGVAKDTIINSYYENGNIKEQLSYNEKQELDGKCYTWTIEGTKTGEASYKDGVKHGVWKIWRNDGTLAYELFYEEGKKKGEWKSYGESGELLAVIKY